MAEFKARLVDKDGNPLGTAANPLKISGGGSASAFTDLTDVPSSYSGLGGKYLKVATTEDGLITDTPAGSGDMTKAEYDSNDDGIVNDSDKWGGQSLPTGSALQVMRWNASNTALEVATLSGAGEHASTHITGGTDVIADAVAGGASGLMSGSDKTKLDGIAAGAEVNVQSDWNATEGDAYIANKPTIPSEYTLPTATDSVLGGVKIGSRLTITDGVLSANEQGGTYTLPTASAETLGGVKIGSGITITDGVISASGGSGSSSFVVQRSIEGVVYETSLMYWVAPATCTINSVSMALSSNPSASSSYCKVQVMKNGTLETNSIFSSDTPMQITGTTTATNGIYQASGTLDTGNNMDDLAAGDVIHFRVNQADTGSADLLVQVKVAFT